MIKGSPWDTMALWVREYGPIYCFHLFGDDAVCVSDPEHLKIVLAQKVHHFKKDVNGTYKPFLDILGTGIVTSDGKEWVRQKILLAKPLKQDILLEVPGMALRAVQRLCVKLDKAKADGTTLEMAEEFRHLTLQVIAEVILSLDPKESDDTFAHMYLPIVEEGNLRTWAPQRMYFPTPAMFEYRKAVGRLNSYVTGLVERRWDVRKIEAVHEKATGEKTKRRMDILDVVISYYNDKTWSKDAVNQIRDEIKTFILAGHETSASMLTWSLYELTQNAKVMQKVVNEANTIFSDTKSKAAKDIASLPNNDKLEGLSYTKNCLLESLRKYSVVPTVVRMCTKPVTLDQYTIPVGTTVMINIQGLHHDPKHWPNPMNYEPERFEKEIKPYSFIPFVEGERMCLGQYLSLLESKCVLALLVQRYKFELVNSDGGEKHPFMIPIIPNKGHYMRIH